MQVVRAIYDGQQIKPIDPIRINKETEVLVIFPDDLEIISSENARALLRGAGKGEKLTEKLLKSRMEDIVLERH